MNTYTNIVSFI